MIGIGPFLPHQDTPFARYSSGTLEQTLLLLSIFLAKYNIANGVSERLTYGNHSTYLQDISPDGKFMIYSTSKENITQRPFSLSSLYLVDLETLKVDTLFHDERFLGGASYSPDGKQLLLTASPEAFGGIGKNCGNHPIANDFDTQAFIMDRAMEGGIDDVGVGVLFGLNTYRYDFTGLLMHAEHLEARFGVGPHTISVPRICSADDIDAGDFPNAISDEIFSKIVAVIRIAVPYTGMIISTRESQESRKKVLELGISQISGGSRTSVGGYAERELPENNI
jgi:hypothetical protein